MKKKYASIADQLSTLKPKSRSLSKERQLSTYSKSWTPEKKDTPCVDPYSGYLFFSFTNEEEAKIIADELWDTASLSSKPSLCEICSHFHLTDPNGLKLTSKEKFVFKPSGKRISYDRCPVCTSNNGSQKAIFKNINIARDALHSIPLDIPYPMYLYECPKGHGFHLTKNSPRKGSNYIATITQIKASDETIKNPQIVRKPTATALERDNKNLFEIKYVCSGCGWKNQDNTLKCAACGELGPYITEQPAV